MGPWRPVFFASNSGTVCDINPPGLNYVVFDGGGSLIPYYNMLLWGELINLFLICALPGGVKLGSLRNLKCK